MISFFKILFITIHCIIIAVLTILFSPIDFKGKITHVLSKIFSFVILKIAGVKINVKGREKLDKQESYIFVSNHQSLFDIPILMQAVPNIMRFIYKKSLSKIPVFGWGMYLGGYIPIDRENPREAIKSFKNAVKKIKNGISVTIFPEGTRSIDGTLGEFKRGAFILANEAKVRIVPTTISGSYKILLKDSFKINSGNIEVVFGDPIEYNSNKNFLNDIKNIISQNLNISLK